MDARNWQWTGGVIPIFVRLVRFSGPLNRPNLLDRTHELLDRTSLHHKHLSSGIKEGRLHWRGHRYNPRRADRVVATASA